VEKCTKQLEEAEQISRELLPLVQEIPDLRHGSFANAMEEVSSLPRIRHVLVPSFLHCQSDLTPDQLICTSDLQYAEAKVFQGFLNYGRVIASKELPIVIRDEYVTA
jgi:hypothetical protein